MSTMKPHSPDRKGAPIAVVTQPSVGRAEPVSADPSIGAASPKLASYRRLSVSRELGRFVLAGVVALVLLGGTGIFALHRVAVSDAIAQAQELSVAETRFVAEPAVTDALVAGDPKELAAFDRLVRRELLKDRVVRIKLWTPQGRVVYSDDTRLIGKKFTLAADDREVLRTGRPSADLSNLSAAENTFERPAGRLLQVYTRAETPTGHKLLFESYLRLDSVLAQSSSLVWSMVPAFLLALLALQALQLPLALRLVRRVQHGQRERHALQRRALEASDHERRRIARDMHDGLVQSLVGLSYSLAAAAERMRGKGESGTADQLDTAATTTRSGVADLRTLIHDIYPPSLEQLGLRASLVELLATAERTGLRTTLDVVADPHVPAEVTAALYRAAQEAVRNVIAHSGATSVRVELVQTSRIVGIVVTDNGVGPLGGTPEPGRPHFGLRMLEDLAGEVGGGFSLGPGPGGGACFRFELPAP